LHSVSGSLYNVIMDLKPLKNSSGFTLLELLVVIVMLGILFASLLAAINPIGQMQKARDSKRIEDLVKINKALVQYYIKHGDLPDNTEDDLDGWDCSNLGQSFLQPLIDDQILEAVVKDLAPADGCGYRYQKYDPANGGCGVYFYVLLSKMELPENTNMNGVFDCYNQKQTFTDSGYYGYSDNE